MSGTGNPPTHDSPSRDSINTKLFIFDKHFVFLEYNFPNTFFSDKNSTKNR